MKIKSRVEMRDFHREVVVICKNQLIGLIGYAEPIAMAMTRLFKVFKAATTTINRPNSSTDSNGLYLETSKEKDRSK